MTDTAPTWSYEPGEHLAVLGPQLAVVVPADQPALAARLWRVVDGGGDLLAVVDVLAAGGLGALAGAAVVAWEGGDRLTVLARGTDPQVVVRSGDGTALVDGTGVRTWTERSFERVRSVSVLAGDRGQEEQDGPVEVLGLGAGLVRVSRVARTVTDPLGGDGPGADTEPDPVTAPVAQGPVEPPQPTLPPADQPTEAHTVLPGPWGPAQARTPLLRVSDGREVVVDAVVVVGRSPGPRDRHAGAPPRMLRLESPQQEISGTHLEVRPGTGPDAGAAVVTDLGSTNGTVVEHVDGPPEALVPGVGVALGPGAVVHVGDGVTLTLLGPGD
ncbi:FHA domain-containing protein [Nocardioides sp. AX2bis]|uniref:FHA domain-containing protein n=1 Tax=Nocardioides sp. AX2bis TaxID=2653157 RepID=UPI0012F3FC75|nr:FHA domain-containing protein [Nocardioides sp. AX2bis]VXA96498.1 conserved hypothetical protein [Nocardioides sp. AX2bis]